MSNSLIKALAVLMITLVAASALPSDQFGGVTYRLGLSQTEVDQPIDAASANLTLNQKTDDLVLLDSQGRTSRINVTPEFWRGDYIYRVPLPGGEPGRLIYTIRSTGQQFIVAPPSAGPVRIALPEGYTTGNRLLGIARPDPDEVLEGPAGRELIWNNISRGQIIEVSYYKEMAPMALLRIFGIIAAAAAVLLAEYYLSMRRLRSIREKDQIPLK